MTDKTTTNFAKMGTEASAVTNVSGAPSKNTKPIKKSAHSKGGSPYPEQTKANRKGVLERNGFKGAPQTTLYAPNAQEASATFRNVRLMPSAIGNRDFYLRRQYGQGM